MSYIYGNQRVYLDDIVGKQLNIPYFEDSKTGYSGKTGLKKVKWDFKKYTKLLQSELNYNGLSGFSQEHITIYYEGENEFKEIIKEQGINKKGLRNLLKNENGKSMVIKIEKAKTSNNLDNHYVSCLVIPRKNDILITDIGKHLKQGEKTKTSKIKVRLQTKPNNQNTNYHRTRNRKIK